MGRRLVQNFPTRENYTYLADLVESAEGKERKIAVLEEMLQKLPEAAKDSWVLSNLQIVYAQSKNWEKAQRGQTLASGDMGPW